jgi:hypothetical protein
MFIGHFAVAFAAKKAAPRTSLGTLLVAATFLDVLFPIFVLLGWEIVRIDPGNTAFTPFDFVSYPWSHSMVMTLAWSAVLALGYFLLTHYRPGAIAIGIGVFSHWILDVISHRADMPLSPGLDTRVGLGLWNSVAGTVIIEGAMFLAAVWLYTKSTRPTSKAGRYGFWSFVAVLIILYISDLFSAPPPNAAVLPIFGIAAWLFFPWAWWFDRHRRQVR